MSLADIEKLTIMSTLQSGGQKEYEYVRQSSSRFVIKRVFSDPATHVFHIPVSKTIISSYYFTLILLNFFLF